MSNERKCLVCGSTVTIKFSPTYKVDCQHCPSYYIASELQDDYSSIYEAIIQESSLNSSEWPTIDFSDVQCRVLFQGFLANYQATTKKPYCLNSLEDIKQIIRENSHELVIQKKLNSILSWFRSQTNSFGEQISFDPKDIFQRFYCRDYKELLNIFYELQNKNLIKFTRPSVIDGTTLGTWRLEITFEGIEYTETRQNKNQQGFIALQLKEENQIDFYEKIKKIVYQRTRFNLVWMGKQHNPTLNGKICDEIIAQINKSKFLIADISYPNLNVYYEAGYAHGKNIHVIFSSEKTKFDVMYQNNSIPFDTRQFNIYDYKTSNPEDFAERIIAFIETRFISSNQQKENG